MEGGYGGRSRKCAELKAGRLFSDSGIPPRYPVGPEVAVGTESARTTRGQSHFIYPLILLRAGHSPWCWRFA